MKTRRSFPWLILSGIFFLAIACSPNLLFAQKQLSTSPLTAKSENIQLIKKRKMKQNLPQYYCTGANEAYFPHLLNLIGSIHKNNFKDLGEIAVFDLGLKPEQAEQIKKIKKVKLYQLKEQNPDLLIYYHLPNGGKVFGWYAWKPVAIKEALEIYPYVLWLDAGTTVLKSLNVVFKYITQTGYFLLTWGDPLVNKLPKYPVSWGTTTFVIDQFNLKDPANQWILSQECITGNIVGVSKQAEDLFVKDWYELTKDLRYFADDGTTPDGYGTGRHDQTLLAILGYLKGLKVHV